MFTKCQYRTLHLLSRAIIHTLHYIIILFLKKANNFPHIKHPRCRNNHNIYQYFQSQPKRTLRTILSRSNSLYTELRSSSCHDKEILMYIETKYIVWRFPAFTLKCIKNICRVYKGKINYKFPKTF
jgi:hypothetical protein